MSVELPIPNAPVRVALIGAGQRAWSIYRPLFSSLKPWIDVVAVCDTQTTNADRMADALGARPFYDIHALMAARPMEAALVITPVESHYAISMFLSSHGVHNLVETSWCQMVAQGQRMLTTASENGVIARVAENFFRMPIDRIVQAINANGFLGPIRRVMSYADHTGYHNNSRWIVFAQAHPTWVQSIEHTIPTVEFSSTPQRSHTTENYRLHAYMFPENLLVIDHAANIKGFLGRQGRPGYTEWQGESGTIVFQSVEPWVGAAEVRYLCEEDRTHVDPEVDHTHPLVSFPVIEEYDSRTWLRSYVDLPTGRVEYVNPYRPIHPSEHRNDWYGVPVMDHLVEFALTVRGVTQSEFSAEDALMSLMMEVGARESSHQDGKRIALPFTGELEADRITGEGLRKKYRVDPLDWEAMLNISYPKL